MGTVMITARYVFAMSFTYHPVEIEIRIPAAQQKHTSPLWSVKMRCILSCVGFHRISKTHTVVSKMADTRILKIKVDYVFFSLALLSVLGVEVACDTEERD